MIKKFAVALSCAVFIVTAQPVEAGFLGGVGRTVKQATRGVSKFARRHRTELITGAGIIIGMGVADNNLLGAAVGGLVGYTIAKSLNASDNKRMARSTQSSLVTGKSSEWRNDETGVSGRTTVKEETVEERTVKAKYLKERITELPPLEYSVGGQYRVVKPTGVRGGPGEDYKSFEELKQDQTVDIVAKVENKDWYLASKNGVATGFIDAGALESTGVPVDTKVQKKGKPKAQVAESEITVKQTCRSIEQQVTQKDGKTVTETRKACQQADGSWS